MDTLARLLLTYLLHSTVLLGLAALARAALRERRLALQEAILRAALLGGFATAALQVGLDVRPLGGSLRMASAALADPRPDVAAERAGLGRSAVPVPARPAPSASTRWETRTLPAPTEWARFDHAVEAGWAVLGTLPVLVTADWTRVLTVAWAALTILALVRLGVAVWRLRRLLRGRRPIVDAELAPGTAAVASLLGLRPPLRLSAAPRLSTPLTTGIVRPEICLPLRAVRELGSDEQVALCAHELAHLARRDPFWVLLARLAECAAPVQPLNRWARLRLLDLAECLSDDLAVRASSRPLGLALSLVDVASWTLGDDRFVPGVAVGALSARSRLGLRVERLMDSTRPLERPRRLLLPVAAAAVLATALVTPVVSGSARSDDALASPAASLAPRSPAPSSPRPAAKPRPALAPAPVTEPVVAQQPTPAADAMPAPALAPAAETTPVPEAAAAELAGSSEDGASSLAMADAERRLAELTAVIEARAQANGPAMEKLQAEIQAQAARVQPNDAELRKLTSAIDAQAAELTAAVAADLQAAPAARRSERTRAAAQRMAELQARIQAAAGDMRVPSADLRALSESARALAERARPTAAELRQIHELARLAALDARAAAPSRQAVRAAAQAAAGEARVAARQAVAAIHEAVEAMRRAAEEARRAADEARRAVDEAEKVPHQR